MSKLRYLLIAVMTAGFGISASAQFNNSGISAGFFDSSETSTINFSKFHLPPLAVLFENAKSNPQILDLAKAQEIAQAEVAKQKKHIFSYVRGHASYSYGKTDMWGNNSSTYNQMIYQFQGSEQNYWNVGVNVNVPLEDLLDLGAAVKRKKLLVDQAQIKKDIAYDQLKLQIASLYVKITNSLISLKTASENAAIYQGAGSLNQEDFHQGNMSIEDFAYTKRGRGRKKIPGNADANHDRHHNTRNTHPYSDNNQHHHRHNTRRHRREIGKRDSQRKQSGGKRDKENRCKGGKEIRGYGKSGKESRKTSE